ncbi:hypothetical protein [Algoriphagus confluentis]|uniref:Uncharacterized protein n=1 Tax=Algoriphagus confluentis TaxID=1697556 RepID=A0ABQ6PRC4_9BACT|nr:hypothetical protein Aconfl_31510 [Algoriphagus confluentis]
MNSFLLILLFIFSGLFSGPGPRELTFSNPTAEIPLEYVDLVSLDTRDQIFASNTSGDVYLYDKNGKQLNLYSPVNQGRLHQLEASWTVNIFTFSADLQEYRIMDRFLNELSNRQFFSSGINLPKAATLGNNNIIWAWDESDLSLKRLNYLQNQIIQSQPLNLILESENLTVSEIREFKNRLFMNVPESGIYIFDNQGNFLQKVNLRIDQRLCFYRENLFWVEGKKLKMYSLGLKAIFDVGVLPSEGVHYLQIGQEIITFVKEDRIEIYPLPEGLKYIN